jgi:hypothetical protein
MLQQPTYGGDNMECYSSQRVGEMIWDIIAAYVWGRWDGMLIAANVWDR